MARIMHDVRRQGMTAGCTQWQLMARIMHDVRRQGMLAGSTQWRLNGRHDVKWEGEGDMVS